MTDKRPRNQIFIGDAHARLTELATHSVDMVLTSPPYANSLRDYGHDGQLGAETTVNDWVAGLVRVTRELGRVLTPTGTLWLNVGDAYSTQARQGAPKKSLLLAPERLALALLSDGWILRNKIVWAKPNAMPSSVTDRLTHKWESIFVLSRSPKYFFGLDALRVPHRTRPPRRRDNTTPQRHRDAWQGAHGDNGSGLARMKAAGRIGHVLGANPGDVWHIGTSSWRGDHHATFPLELATRAITAGAPELVCTACAKAYRRPVIRALGQAAVRGELRAQCGCDAPNRAGIVLDPFLGSGTTGVAAERLHRDWLGIELNPGYAAIASKRIADARRSTPPKTPRSEGGPTQ